jgi:hypothetical protein
MRNRANGRNGRARPASTGVSRVRGVRSAAVLPGGLVIPPGVDPVIADLIGQVNSPDHTAWMGQVARIGGCANPLHLCGFTRVRDSTTGRVDYEFDSREAPGGVVLVRCRNRREAICPSCARLYQGDVYHLVRAGLDGGKGIPETVAAHPRVFATLTAPSFGAVHSARTQKDGTAGLCRPRRTPGCVHGRATACFARHTDDDPLVGSPLCEECYDYRAAVIWQASVGKLWQRFTTYLPRHLAAVAGRSRADVRSQVRVSYVKIAEYQRRGLVHIHAVIRADGIPPDDRDGDQEDGAARVIAPADWVTAGLLEKAVAASAGAVRVRVDGGPAGAWTLGWGAELDVHDIIGRSSGQSPGRVAAYVAKYASKSTEVTGWDFTGRENTPRAAHTGAMVRAAFALAEVPELAELKLGRWVKALAYRGHVSSKSRKYSTTLGALRQARAQHRIGAGQTLTQDGVNLVVESAWELVGHGYTPGQALLAADIARDIRLNRAAAREAGDARPRVGGRELLRRGDDVSERGVRGAPGSGDHNS